MAIDPHKHIPILSTETLFVWLVTLMNIYLFCTQKLFVWLLTRMNIYLFCPQKHSLAIDPDEHILSTDTLCVATDPDEHINTFS